MRLKRYLALCFLVGLWAQAQPAAPTPGSSPFLGWAEVRTAQGREELIVPVTRLELLTNPPERVDGTLRRVEDFKVVGRVDRPQPPLQTPVLRQPLQEQTITLTLNEPGERARTPVAGLQTLTLRLDQGRTLTRSFIVVRDADRNALLLRLDPALSPREQIALATSVLGQLDLRRVRFTSLPMTPGRARAERGTVCADTLVRLSWEGGDLGRLVRALNLIRDGLAQLRVERGLPPRADDPFGADPWYGPDPDSAHDLSLQPWPSLAESPFDPAKARQQRQDVGAEVTRAQTDRTPAIIAVLDTGVAAHPELNLMLPGYNVVGDRSVVRGPLVSAAQELPGDLFDGRTPPETAGSLTGHGTGVAVLAAGRLSGVAPGARVLPVTVCDPQGRCRASDVARGVCYALAQARSRGDLVINLSLGGSTPSLLLERVLGDALGRGALIAAAGGNDGDDPARRGLPHYPAAHRLPGLLAVAALGPRQPGAPWTYASFTTLGEDIDIAAPGTGLQTGGPAGGYWLNMRGSSFAAPQVAGAMALGFGRFAALPSAGQRAGETLKWLMGLARQPACPGNVSRPGPGADTVCSVLNVATAP